MAALSEWDDENVTETTASRDFSLLIPPAASVELTFAVDTAMSQKFLLTLFGPRTHT
jgi:hypothetical protein